MDHSATSQVDFHISEPPRGYEVHLPTWWDISPLKHSVCLSLYLENLFEMHFQWQLRAYRVAKWLKAGLNQTRHMIATALKRCRVASEWCISIKSIANSVRLYHSGAIIKYHQQIASYFIWALSGQVWDLPSLASFCWRRKKVTTRISFWQLTTALMLLNSSVKPTRLRHSEKSKISCGHPQYFDICKCNTLLNQNASAYSTALKNAPAN